MSDQQPQQIGTPDEQTAHREVPTVAEHNDRMHTERPDDCVGNGR
jgi:hypothetical protein